MNKKIEEDNRYNNKGQLNRTLPKKRNLIYKIEKYSKKFLLSLRKAGSLLYKGLSCLKNYGFRYTWKKVLLRKKMKAKIASYTKGAIKNSYKISKEQRIQQSSYPFQRDIKISIVVPLYNTPVQFLHEMLDSLKKQTYANWELCLVDGSDGRHSYVKDICMKAAESDSRIIYKILDENLGISENTNRCIEMSTGEYIGLLDHDDLLHPSALFEVMKAICDKNADFIYTDENTFSKTPKDAYCPHFKPDFAPDSLRSLNYICHFTVFSRALLEKAGKFRKEFDGSQDYDFVLRLTEKANCIVHIPRILYFWRAHKSSVALNVTAKPYAIIAAKKALAEHLKRMGLEAAVLDSVVPSTYKMQYAIKGNPLISILIPNKDHVHELRECIESIFTKSSYRNFEIVIIENNSKEAATFEYYKKLQTEHEHLRIVNWTGRFNFSAINNFGFKHAHGEYILLLNNDMEVITPDWLQEMLMFAQRADVGAVGAKLYYPDDTIQHAGVILGIGGVAGHSHKYFPREDLGYMGRLTYAQNLSAVTAACMMIPRHVYEEVQGLDESFEVAFNDVDFCIRIRKAGYLIVFTPYAELYHYESKSRGKEDTLEKQERFSGEVLRFQHRWENELEQGDPYYNLNLTLSSEDFLLR